MSQVLDRLGRFAARRPLVVIGAWLVVAVLVVASAASFGKHLEDPFEAPGLDSQRATELLSRAGAAEAGLTADVVLSPASDVGKLTDAAAEADLRQVRTALEDLPQVEGTTQTVSPDGRVALVRVQYPVLEDLSAADLDRLKTAMDEARSSTSLRVEGGGDLFFTFEAPPAGLAEGLGLVAAMVILLLAFGSVVAMGLPIVTALLGLAVGVGSLTLVAYVVDVPGWAPVLGSMVGLGVGIDYALFILTRHRELLAQGWRVEDAVAGAMASAGRAVVVAGGTVVVAILGLAVARIPFITAGGIALSLVVLVMVLASITLLPALLGLAGHRVNALRVRRVRTESGDGWRRWASHVARHAAAYAVGATVLLIALAAPVTALRLGFPDQGTMPESRTERRAYDLVTDGFGRGANGPLVIAVDTAGDASVIGPLASAVAADPGIASVGPPRVDPTSGVAALVAQPTTSPQDQATRDTIERLRSDVFPTVLAGHPASAHVGGQVATFADLGHRVEDRLPAFIAAVVTLSVVLLLVVFRSVVVPLKAAAMNLLSVGAAYGVLVMVFQWGWGADLIGLESTVPILSFIPLFMFAILFGLSMDYEVFLLSRIREEYLRTGDNDEAVVRGLAGTGRTITSAALIMVAVFSGFILGEDPLIKMMGLGLATAIAVDATIVRLILVPATMKLLGEANWWLPAWLDRLLPGGRAGVPEPRRGDGQDSSRPEDVREPVASSST